MGVSGSLQVKDGKFYAVLSLKTNELTKKGAIKYKTKWISTGLEVKGNKKRAKQFLHEKCIEYSGRNVDYCDMYFADYMNMWLEETKAEIRPNTYRGYKGNVKNHIVPYFSPRRVKIQELTVNDLEEFYKYLVFERSKSDGSEPLSPTTITHIHRCISKALNDAARKGVITVNVASLARKPHSVKFKSQYLNEKQVNQLLQMVKDTTIETPVVLCAVFGLRRGEVLGLKWKEVDMVNRTITISETLQQHVGGSYTSPPKTESSYRTLPIPDEVYQYLVSIKRQQNVDKEVMGNGYQDGDYVCAWPDGRVIEPNYLTRNFHDMIVKSDLPNIRLHDLRHSVASNLLNMGFTVVQVQEWLGHSSAATTLNFYAHVDKTSKLNISRTLNTKLEIKI